jgi:6-phosphofructokinase 2
MPPILTITLNPALDLATSVDGIVPGPKLRCTPPLVDPGGGGVNVSRVIKRLGGGTLAIIAAGGAVGEEVLTCLKREGIHCLVIQIAGNTRQSLVVTDDRLGNQFRFILPGPTLSETEVSHVLDRITEATPQSGFVVLSGSQPNGVPADFPELLSERILSRTAKLCVDTTGPAIDHLITNPTIPPYLLRLDRVETEAASGKPLLSIEEAGAFARSLISRSVASLVVLGRGEEGSVAVTSDCAHFCKAAEVSVKSTTGAGDSFMGAMVLSLSRNEGTERALQWGVAAASAAVMTDASQLCIPEMVAQILPSCIVSNIPI